VDTVQRILIKALALSGRNDIEQWRNELSNVGGKVFIIAPGADG
jgi:hypothetical protein